MEANFCELLGLSSNLRAAVSLSLAELAEHGRPPKLSADACGVAYYEGSDARLIKNSVAAVDSDWIGFLKHHEVRSSIVMAHIRHAIMGQRAYRNTQPFGRELAGRKHIFAHNGWLPGLLKSPTFRSQRYTPMGETDSEFTFCGLLERLQDAWRPGEVPTLAARMAIVNAFAVDLRTFGPANFLYSDGSVLFAHGHRRMQVASGAIAPPGLVVLERACSPEDPGLVTSGLSIRPDGQRVVLVASVPLTQEDWLPLAEGEVIALSDGAIALRTR